jgi:O-antigen ligase
MLLSVISLVTLNRGLSGGDVAFAHSGRLTGTDTSNPITLGHYGATLGLLSLYLLVRAKGRTRKSSVLFVGSLLLGTMIVILSASRGPLFALLIGATVLAFCLPPSRHRFTIRVLFALLALSLVLFYTNLSPFVTGLGGSMEQRLRSTKISDQTAGQDIRVGLWERAITTAMDNPALGYGIDLPDEGYPHNIALEAFVSLGVIGGTLFLALLAACVVRSVAFLRSSDDRSWIGLLFIQFTVAAMLSGALFTVAEFWCFCAAIAGMGPITSSHLRRPRLKWYEIDNRVGTATHSCYTASNSPIHYSAIRKASRIAGSAPNGSR